MKACCADLRLLNKGDFKMLLKWRLEMLKAHKEEIKKMRAADHADHADHEGHDNQEEEEKEEEGEKKTEEVSTEQQLQEVREKVAVRARAGREA